MLRRAVERGVTPDRLAKALNVDVSQIHKKVSLLEGICPEAVEMLKDQHFSANLGAVLRKMKPTRQVECVELMLRDPQPATFRRGSGPARTASAGLRKSPQRPPPSMVWRASRLASHQGGSPQPRQAHPQGASTHPTSSLISTLQATTCLTITGLLMASKKPTPRRATAERLTTYSPGVSIAGTVSDFERPPRR